MPISAISNRNAINTFRNAAEVEALKGASIVAQAALLCLLWAALCLLLPLPYGLSGLSIASDNVSSASALGSTPALAVAVWSFTVFIALASCIRFWREPMVWIAVATLTILTVSGHVSLLLVVLCSLFFLALWLEHAERGVFFGALSILCGLQMVAALLAYAFGFEQQLTPGFGTRASGVLASPNTLYPLAVIALCGFSAICSLAPSAKIRAATALGAALAFVVAILTFSRSGWIGMAAAIGVLAILLSSGHSRENAPKQAAHKNPSAGSRSALVPLAMGLILLLLMGAAVVRTQGMIATPSNDLSAATRWSYWQEAARLWGENPWFGLGPSGFARYGVLEPAPADPKNLFLQVGVQSGLVGLVLAAAFAALVARAAWRIEKHERSSWGDKAIARACLLSLTAMLAAGLFDTPIFALPDRIPSTLLMLLLAAMICRIASSLRFYDDLDERAETVSAGDLPLRAPVSVQHDSAKARRIGIAAWCGVVLLVVSVGVFGYQRAFGGSWSGRCVLVIDGDTLLVQHGERLETVRLWGIDAPENAQPFGAQAQRFAAERAQNQEVTVEVKGHDRYKRTLGTVVLPNRRVLNEELLKNGLAWWYQYFNPHQHDLEAYETKARQSKIGLWSVPEPKAPWDYRRSHRKPITNSGVSDES